MPFGTLIEAEYEDGFILKEDEKDAYFCLHCNKLRNIFHAILHDQPVVEHGHMIRWTVVTPKLTYSVDWKALLDNPAIINPRPVCSRDMERDFDVSTGEPVGPARVMLHIWGYQYNNPDGSNGQDVQKFKV